MALDVSCHIHIMDVISIINVIFFVSYYLLCKDDRACCSSHSSNIQKLFFYLLLHVLFLWRREEHARPLKCTHGTHVCRCTLVSLDRYDVYDVEYSRHLYNLFSRLSLQNSVCITACLQYKTLQPAILNLVCWSRFDAIYGVFQCL